ncbi:MAG: tetratricopeptide repeat protein, partial [Nitrospinaceae bacterium]|nr:tetratricopeptide repeat protein [Nitrospinaceae bacterium]NIS83825.1 tetratricopeptide repeat protein [Nitrospinaceae bacterium]NIU95021.1 tetratricopeptide repeat protein [Nitrospinaceae bacterium]
ALRLEADHGHVRILLAKQCIRLNRLEDAERLMQEETRRFGPSPETEYLRGLMAQHRGDPREAALHLDRFRTRFPARSDAWQALVESFTALEDREQLKRLYVEASHIRSLADREWVQTRIATALAGLDREERPEHETLAHYWKRNPANSLLLYARASAFERAGEPDRAAELFRQVTQATRSSDPVRGSAWFRLARQAAGAQRIEYARNCLSLCPDHEGARNLLLQEVAEGTPDLSGIKKTGHPTEDPA